MTKKTVTTDPHKKLYMCKIDFDYELGNAAGGNTVYPSLKDLKKNHKCWKECGIVQVEVKKIRTVAKEQVI